MQSYLKSHDCSDLVNVINNCELSTTCSRETLWLYHQEHFALAMGHFHPDQEHFALAMGLFHYDVMSDNFHFEAEQVRLLTTSVITGFRQKTIASQCLKVCLCHQTQHTPAMNAFKCSVLEGVCRHVIKAHFSLPPPPRSQSDNKLGSNGHDPCDRNLLGVIRI